MESASNSDQFKSIGEEVHDYWQNDGAIDYPILSKVAKRVLQYPCTSSSLERQFGKISEKLRPETANVQAETLEFQIQNNTKSTAFIENFKKSGMQCAKPDSPMSE